MGFSRIFLQSASSIYLCILRVALKVDSNGLCVGDIKIHSSNCINNVVRSLLTYTSGRPNM